jgi:hypothetical protein
MPGANCLNKKCALIKPGVLVRFSCPMRLYFQINPQKYVCWGGSMWNLSNHGLCCFCLYWPVAEVLTLSLMSSQALLSRLCNAAILFEVVTRYFFLTHTCSMKLLEIASGHMKPLCCLFTYWQSLPNFETTRWWSMSHPVEDCASNIHECYLLCIRVVCLHIRRGPSAFMSLSVWERYAFEN